MTTITLEAEVEVDIDVVKDWFDRATEKERRDVLGQPEVGESSYTSVADEIKQEIVNRIADKFTIEKLLELERSL